MEEKISFLVPKDLCEGCIVTRCKKMLNDKKLTPLLKCIDSSNIEYFYDEKILKVLSSNYMKNMTLERIVCACGGTYQGREADLQKEREKHGEPAGGICKYRHCLPKCRCFRILP